MSITTNIRRINTEIKFSGAKLVAVSKLQSNESIIEAFEAGQIAFGENYVQEMCAKYDNLPKAIEWHFIGHLQSNKVKFIAPFVHTIHAVDSIKLLDSIQKEALKNNRLISILAQVHIANEDTKFGMDKNELLEFVSYYNASNYSNVKLIGLMGMASFSENTEIIQSEYSTINALFIDLKRNQFNDNESFNQLSIGMTSDYKIAIDNGSTIVRIGSAIFGERNK